ncbi:MAG: 16S rRNA (adenine(1518)-N(6)/adenine(1519)-N(6))-dimethyltransferase RsmA [Gemmatimonadaceae bacterium]
MPDESHAPVPRHAPRKRFGQHFLTDRAALEKIVDAVADGCSAGDVIVEIGPGQGALTDVLLARGLRVVAVEIDRDLVRLLRERYAAQAAFRIVEGDALAIDLAQAGGPAYRLVGNLPYYITTPLIFHALASPRPARAVFLVQREVADRLVAAPGSPEYGALTVNVRSVATVEMIGKVKAGAFHPPPKVDSAIVRLEPRPDILVGPDDERAFREFVIAMFGQRRKQAARALRHVRHVEPEVALSILRQAGFDATRRAETLTPDEFAQLFFAAAEHDGRPNEAP